LVKLILQQHNKQLDTVIANQIHSPSEIATHLFTY